MEIDYKKFPTSERELAEILGIELKRLDEIIDFFDSDPRDEWDLVENEHYVFYNKATKERFFSALGAYAIAKYLDVIEQKSLFEKVKEFFTHHKQRVRQSFIATLVRDNRSSIVIRNGRWYLNKKGSIAALATSYKKLNDSFNELQRAAQPLEIDKDFIEIEGGNHYSGSGLRHISTHLSKTLTRQDRREWCSDAAVVIPKELKRLEAEEAKLKKRIENAKKRAKTRDRHTCQITGEKPTKYDKFELDVHHIFSQAEYPHLADNVENLITLKAEIHEQFHKGLGGTQVTCTIDHLLEFVSLRYPGSPHAISKITAIKRRLGPQSPTATNDRKPKTKKAKDAR